MSAFTCFFFSSRRRHTRFPLVPGVQTFALPVYSANVLQAAEAAKARGMTVIGLTGEGGGRLAPLCDILIDTPSRHTPHVQQIHACLYHYICEQAEAALAV